MGYYSSLHYSNNHYAASHYNNINTTLSPIVAVPAPDFISGVVCLPSTGGLSVTLCDTDTQSGLGISEVVLVSNQVDCNC